MKYLKILGLAAIAAMALTALFGGGTAGASILKVFGAGASLGTGTVIEASLESGNSTISEDSFGLTGTTCTGSSVAGVVSRTTQGFQAPDTATGQPKGSLSGLSFTPCPHTADVESKGTLEIRNIAGTTNGTVFSAGLKVKLFSTLLNQNCIASTGIGTDIGTLTGATAASSKATIDFNGLIPLESCSAANSRWTGKYDVSKPLGLVSEA